MICQYSSNGDTIFSFDADGSFEQAINLTNSKDYSITYADLGFTYYRYENYTSKIIATKDLYYSRVSQGSYGNRITQKHKIPKGTEISINTKLDYTSVHMFSFD